MGSSVTNKNADDLSRCLEMNIVYFYTHIQWLEITDVVIRAIIGRTRVTSSEPAD
jgi:hypothetical protein